MFPPVLLPGLIQAFEKSFELPRVKAQVHELMLHLVDKNHWWAPVAQRLLDSESQLGVAKRGKSLRPKRNG